MSKKSIVSLGLSLLFCAAALAQKFVVLEKTNSPKTTRFYVGQRITFKMDGAEGWFSRQITDIFPEKNIVLLDGEAVALDEITALKIRKRPIWTIIGSQLLTFGTTLAIATTIAKAREGADSRLYLLSAASLTGGFWLAKPRKIRLGNRHRLRLLDLTLQPPSKA